MSVLLKHNCACRDDGVGLAAPQVGVNVRLMVYNPTGRRGGEEYILVNPKILHTSGKRDTAEEGCLSFPRLFADVEVSAQFLSMHSSLMASYPCGCLPPILHCCLRGPFTIYL